MKAPWKIQVNVQEKQVVGCIQEGKAYVYFDQDGLMMRKTTSREKGIPVVEGIKAKNTGQFEYLKVDNEKIFSYIVNLTKEVKEKKLKFTYKGQKEYETIEEEIANLEEKIEELESSMGKFASDFVKLNQITKEKEEAEAMLIAAGAIEE